LESLLLKRNLIANYLGQGWRAIMALAFVPAYVGYLGIESYGLIGLFAVFQTSLGLLDMGMKPALGREMARYTSGTHNEQTIWNLLRSIEVLSVTIATVVVIAFWCGSYWFANDWVQAQALSAQTVSQAFSLMGVVAALQFMDGVYTSCLGGLQRQVIQNVVMTTVATLRGVGAIGVLVWISPTIQAFFLWQCACSVLSVLVHLVIVYRVLPRPPQPARFAFAALLSVWRFAAGMMGITFLVLLLIQVDKILLSRMLTLEAFGYYALAGAVAGSLPLLVGPITAAYYPRFTSLVVNTDEAGLKRAFHNSAQLVSVIVGATASVLILFAAPVLVLWTGNQNLAAQVAPVMSVLTLGTLLNCLMWVPYQMQLAHGWTSLAIWINVAAVILLVPTILLIVPMYGPIAAAWIWVALNASYCTVGSQLMFRRILTTEKRNWYLRDVFLPLLAAFAMTALAKLAFPRSLDPWVVLIVGGASIGVAGLTVPFVRLQLWRWVTQS
jgi:O-antigen/teichoic acid export membrane protein